MSISQYGQNYHYFFRSRQEYFISSKLSETKAIFADKYTPKPGSFIRDKLCNNYSNLSFDITPPFVVFKSVNYSLLPH